MALMASCQILQLFKIQHHHIKIISHYLSKIFNLIINLLSINLNIPITLIMVNSLQFKVILKQFNPTNNKLEMIMAMAK
jgi:hypothetical protein